MRKKTKQSPDVALMMGEVKRLKRALERERAGAEIVRSAFVEAYSEPLEVEVRKPPAVTKRQHTEEAVLHLTDLHIGKRTRSYDSTVVADRLKVVSETTARITQIRRSMANISRLTILLGGDMVEGEGAVFPRQAHEIDQYLVDQAIRVGPARVASLVLELSQVFPEIHVAGVLGNHGQTSRFAPRNSNADGVFCEILRMIVQAAPGRRKITWDLPLDLTREHDPWWAHAVVAKRWGILLVHGDQIRGALGYPWYGVGRKARGWADMTNIPPWDYLFLGHWHTDAVFSIGSRKVFSTPALESDNDFAAESLAACSDPQQRLCFFSENHGLISDNSLYLSPKRPNRK